MMNHAQASSETSAIPGEVLADVRVADQIGRSGRRDDGAGEPPTPWYATRLALAVIGAALLRVGWAFVHGLAIENEGAEYARIAMNLLDGRGYVGMLNNGTQLNFPPLYPLLIAAVSLVTRDAELAARTINILFGALLVVPMFKIAEHAYGRRPALAVAALVVFHPVLIAAGASTYAEGPYLTLTAFAMLYLIRWVGNRRPAEAVKTGIFFGCAYLIRPEAFLTVGLFVACGLALAIVRSQRRSTCTGIISMIGAFAVVAAPNVLFLTASTGQFRIQAKGALVYYWGERMNRGMSYNEAALGVGADLSDQGVFMRSNLDVLDSTSYSASDFLSYVARVARKNLIPIARTLTAQSEVGSPWLFNLVAIGLFRTAWDRRRLIVDSMMLITAATSVVVLLTILELWFRLFIVPLGLLVLWAGKGADELYQWGHDTFLIITGRVRLASPIGSVLKWTAILLVLGTSLRVLPTNAQFGESHNRERRQAGQWLAQQEPRPTWVMDVGLQVGYYAGADVIFLPFAEADVALRYIAKRKPDYIVLLGGSHGFPYTVKWFREGIPDKRAVLVYDQGTAEVDDPGTSSTERIKIYRWVDEPTRIVAPKITPSGSVATPARLRLVPPLHTRILPVPLQRTPSRRLATAVPLPQRSAQRLLSGH